MCLESSCTLRTLVLRWFVLWVMMAQSEATGSAGDNADPEYCLTYPQDYGTIGYSGTADATDDIADGKFQVDKFYAYAPCAEGGGGGSEADSTQRMTISIAGMMLFSMIAWHA